MTLPTLLNTFSPLDLLALLGLALCSIGTGWRIEHPNARHLSVAVLMEAYRREWMVTMVHRSPRIFDAQLVGDLRRGTSFLASGSMIAIGGLLALIGNTDPLAEIAADLTLDATPDVVWEIKILLVLFLLVVSFLKYFWAHRLFGYCAILMAAVPNQVSDPLALPRAAQAAEINITAARSFNRGMRATYFALGSVAWLLGPAALIATTLATTAILWRREFTSHSRRILLQSPPNAAP